MHPESKADAGRTSRVATTALAAVGVALLVAGVLATYEASFARARAVRDVVRASPAPASEALQYLPGASTQIGTLREPLMEARRAALRAGFDGDDAPVDAFDRLRSVPAHDEEARSLLSQFWERKAMLADDPVRRVLYALQARVVDDDDLRRRTAESAIAALGPLRSARHVVEGTVLASDARTLVVRGSGWLHVVNRETHTSFDLSDEEAGAALVDGDRMVTWGDGAARIWELAAGAMAPASPAASFKLLAGEVPLAFSGASPDECVLTSAGRVWRPGEGAMPLSVRGRWTAGSVNATCDRVVLLGDTVIAAARRRGKAWTVEPGRALGGVDCDVKRFSPDGTRLVCRESQRGVMLCSEDATGTWTPTDLMLPALTGVFLQDDGTICGSIPRSGPAALDRADLAFFAPQACPAPPAAERAWGSIRMLPTGSGAVFTYPAAGKGASANTSFFGFDSKGESLAAASNAWFGERRDERLLEHDATNSAGAKGYELAGVAFDPASALGSADVSSVQIDQAVFVESPEPSMLFEMSYASGSASAPGPLLRAVVRWGLREKSFCGPALPGAMTGIAPPADATRDAVVIEGRIYRLGPCTADRGVEPVEGTDATDVVAVGPGAALWISRDGESLELRGAQRERRVVPSAAQGAEKGSKTQVAFSPNGARFLVKTPGSLCDWAIRDDGTPDLEGCRWSTGGWASDAAWAAADRTGETVVVFDRTSEGAALREFFGSGETRIPADTGGDLACAALPGPRDPPLAVLQRWEERLGHAFKDQTTPSQDTREMMSPEIVPMEASPR